MHGFNSTDFNDVSALPKVARQWNRIWTSQQRFPLWNCPHYAEEISKHTFFTFFFVFLLPSILICGPKTKLFENDDVTIITWFPWPSFRQWPAMIVVFSNPSGIVWTENIWCVFRVKPPFSNSSGVLWTGPQTETAIDVGVIVKQMTKVNRETSYSEWKTEDICITLGSSCLNLCSTLVYQWRLVRVLSRENASSALFSY